MLRQVPWLMAATLLFAAQAGRAQETPGTGDTTSVSPQDAIEDLRQEFNAALADLAARLNEARNRQAQASVDGVIYARWSDELQQNPGSNLFEIDRAYLNVRGTLSRRGVYRLTLDAARTSGERLFDFMKYGYGGVALSPQATVMLGIQTTPLIDFQEGVWKYRFVQKVLMDDEKVSSSADLGLGAEGALNGRLSYKVLIANGDGYTKPEGDRQKDFSGRLTYVLRPGLRASAFAQYGLIDTSKARLQSQARHRYDLFLSYEQPRWTLFAEALGAEDQAKVGGPQVQSGGLCVGGFWEYSTDWRVFGKLDLFDANRQSPDNAHLRSVAGLSYNWGTNLIVALSDMWTTFGAAAGARNNNQIAIQTQVTY